MTRCISMSLSVHSRQNLPIWWREIDLSGKCCLLIKSIRSSTTTVEKSGRTRWHPKVKVFTLRIHLVEPYRKNHQKNRSSRSTCRIVCTHRINARFLVQAEKYRKLVSFFNKASTPRSRIEGMVSHAGYCREPELNFRGSG